jgi:hypothetical protein
MKVQKNEAKKIVRLIVKMIRECLLCVPHFAYEDQWTSLHQRVHHLEVLIPLQIKKLFISKEKKSHIEVWSGMK